MDHELARLARGSVCDRLALGVALHRLGSRFKELGFRTFGAYVRERLSLGPRWCGDTRALARRLETRPAVRSALVEGRIGWSLAELLARALDDACTPEEEAELLAAVEGLSVREVREALRERGVRDDDELEDAFTTLDVSVTRTELAALEATRMGIEHVNGGVAEPGHWLECLLSEGLSTLLDVRPEMACDASLDALCDGVDAPSWVRRRQAVEEATPWASRSDAIEAEPFDEEPSSADDPVSLDRVARDRAARLASRDVWLGQLLSRFLLARGWARLGYASEQHYCDERLGMARSTARSRITLARKMVWLEGLDAVVEEGRLGYQHASLVARVANPDTLDAWVERAQARTFKHLREEVQAIELIAQLTDAPPCTLGPPDEDELEAVVAFEREVLSGECIAEAVREGREAARVQMSVGREGGEAAALDASRVQMSVGRQEGNRADEEETTDARRVGYKVRAREEVVWYFRQLEAVFARSGLPGSFPTFLVVAFFDAWGERFTHGNRWKAIHDRDRHRCVSPVCESRSVTNHHLRYRAHGGGDEAENQITLCEFCHLEGEHGGRLRVRGTASHLSWSFGREPVLRVEGREKVA